MMATLALVTSPVVLFSRRILGDQLTPVVAYRKLVAPDERTAPSFLFESVEQGGAVGRYSILGAQPALEIIAKEQRVTITQTSADGQRTVRHEQCADPLSVAKSMQSWSGVDARGPLPDAFHGGWVGAVGFDSVRWMEPQKLPFSSAPKDDRQLPDMNLALYRNVVVFDHATKILFIICAILPGEHPSDAVDVAGRCALDQLEQRLTAITPQLPLGKVSLDTMAIPADGGRSTTTREQFESSVRQAKEYIAAGDAFQVVLSQRFERESAVDPFDVYRALRVVNPSPYQVYLQAEGCILVAASPEILCRTRAGQVTNRPLAGTRRRGSTPSEDRELELELLADEKERAEHTMLVDLGRNDLGRVCVAGSVHIQRSMEIERFSHVMHISSTITGTLRPGLDGWDALRATLPVGTVSGAPKVRAIQIIDELEPVRRGPYAGGLGAMGWNGDLDMAIALRTIVVPLPPPTPEQSKPIMWSYHMQTGAGVVIDSDPAKEFEETRNKAAGLARALDLAENAFSA
ncbi:MAG: anthranilate synthase component I [Phycisphaerales bacterium]|nr:anthranilate synthase component I [Phycisphaerales bacterium]